MNQTLRIIGGKYRGKKFSFPEVEGLRPTPDRVRETLFNWLMKDIHHARCLDAFAGSGALGMEAYSRGAKQVCFIESAPLAYTNLQKNLAHFNSQSLELIKADACEYLKNNSLAFDIIFLDPPFAKNLLAQCFTAIANGKSLSTNGLVYYESADETVLDPLIWQVLKLKKAGQVFYGLARKNEIRTI